VESGYVRTPALLNAVLSRVVGLGGWVVQYVRLPFGLSVVAVARRPLAATASRA
jgi:hypothetical protein